MYNSDKPIQSSSEDLLGRRVFSQQLADAIREFPPDDPFVVGLYGAWGSGKTSILNMTKECLESQSKNADDHSIIVISYNPWNFTSCNQLIDQFFKTILSKLNFEDKTGKQKQFGEALEKYSSIFELAEFIPVVGPFLKILSRIIESAGGQIAENAEAKESNFNLQKQNVIDALKGYPDKIVLVIDDIDRLPNDQIRMIFQLVTTVADFPHIVYLLSFDKKVVANALKETQQCDGEEYLEKVIQVPFEIPHVKPETTHRLLHEELISLCPPESDPTYDEIHWQNVFDNCISPYIRTIRDIVRYINTLQFKFTPLKEEINFIDLAGITAIQVFDTLVYEWIKHNKDDLLGWSSRYLEEGLFGEKEDLKAQYRSIFEKMHPNTFETRLIAVASLFPVFGASIKESLEALRVDSVLRNCLSIAFKDRFYSYFTLSLDDIVISQAELNSSIQEMSEIELSLLLAEYIKTRIITNYFDALSAKLSTIPGSRIRLISTVLFNLNFDIHDTNYDNVEFQYLLHCQHLLSEILLLIEKENERCDFYCDLLTKAQVHIVWASTSHLYLMEQSHQRMPTEYIMIKTPVFCVESLEKIESVLISRLSEIARSILIFDWDLYGSCSMIWKTFGAASYESYMGELFNVPSNKLKYIALQMILSRRPLDDNNLVYNCNISLGDLITTEDALTCIKSSIADHSIFEQPQSIQENLAAFYLYASRNIVVDAPPIRAFEVEQQIKRWEDVCKEPS